MWWGWINFAIYHTSQFVYCIVTTTDKDKASSEIGKIKVPYLSQIKLVLEFCKRQLGTGI